MTPILEKGNPILTTTKKCKTSRKWRNLSTRRCKMSKNIHRPTTRGFKTTKKRRQISKNVDKEMLNDQSRALRKPAAFSYLLFDDHLVHDRTLIFIVVISWKSLEIQNKIIYQGRRGIRAQMKVWNWPRPRWRHSSPRLLRWWRRRGSGLRPSWRYWWSSRKSEQSGRQIRIMSTLYCSDSLFFWALHARCIIFFHEEPRRLTALIPDSCWESCSRMEMMMGWR